MSQGCEGPSIGVALGYGMLQETGRFESMDAERPIVATFTLEQMPDGIPPEEVRQQCVGLQIPLRQGYADRTAFSSSSGNSADVSPTDVVLSALFQDRVGVASWFYHADLPKEYTPGRFTAPDLTDWEYDTRDGTVRELDAKPSTLEYYAGFVPDAVMKQLRNMLWEE